MGYDGERELVHVHPAIIFAWGNVLKRFMC